jgi:hypothetical protein
LTNILVMRMPHIIEITERTQSHKRTPALRSLRATLKVSDGTGLLTFAA